MKTVKFEDNLDRIATFLLEFIGFEHNLKMTALIFYLYSITEVTSEKLKKN